MLKQHNFRLSEETLKKIDVLSVIYSLNRTDLLRYLINKEINQTKLE